MASLEVRRDNILVTVKLDVVIAMPAFNEESAIPDFLAEIVEAFADLRFHLVVVNDDSTDNTDSRLHSLATTYPLEVHTNSQNYGHGPSTLAALRLALRLSPGYVLATDGDGHVAGSTLRHLYDLACEKTTPMVIEGARSQRDEPWFRKSVSAAARILVQLQSSKPPPRDANTPFRVYPTEFLHGLLAEIPDNHMTPNLMMSKLVRQHDIPFAEVLIAQHKREGAIENGSSWKQRSRLIPSRRFLKFCVKAATQWITTGRLSK